MAPKDIFLHPSLLGSAGASLLSGQAVSNGEPITADVTNRLPQVNTTNTAYLYELFRKDRNTSGSFLWNVPVASGVVPGDFVYFDAGAGVFDKALAKFQMVTVQGQSRYVESETSAVWGLVVATRDEYADICIDGLCEFKTQRPEYLLESEPGLRFLSTSVPGASVRLATALPEKCLGSLVGVKPASADVQFFVRTNLAASAKIHEHKSVELPSVPAGDIAIAGGRTIDNPQESVAGWLPANHSLFAGRAPVNAVYGYNPASLTNFLDWPLHFAANAKLRWQRPPGTANTEDPISAGIPQEFYEITNETIWWTTTKYVPWYDNVSWIEGVASGTTPNAGYVFRVHLDYIPSGYGVSSNLVTSLRAKAGSGLSLSQYPFAKEASTGDLLLDFNFEFTEEEQKDASDTAIKKIDGYKLSSGPVVSGIKLDSKRLRIIQGSNSRDDGFVTGSVILGDTTGIVGQEIPFEAIHLGGVEEALFQDSVGLAFPSNRPTHLIARIVVPYSEDFLAMDLSFVFGLLLPRPGNISASAITLQTKVIEPATANNVATPVLGSSATFLPVPCSFAVTNNLGTSAYYQAESSRISVKPGSILFLKMERTPPDGFTDRILLLRKSAMLRLP